MTIRKLLLIPLFVFVPLFLMAASCNGTDNPITETELTEIAKDAVSDDGFMEVDYSERDVLITDKGESWEISFPFTLESNRIGGEPHVVISKTDNEVTKIFYTR